MHHIANRSSEADVVAGVRLFGLDAEVHRKIEAKRDPIFERQIGEWVAAVTGEPLAPDADVIDYLKSGIVLCKYVGPFAAPAMAYILLQDSSMLSSPIPSRNTT